jgi:hypothetical protein
MLIKQKYFINNKTVTEFLVDFRVSNNYNKFLKRYNVISNVDGSLYDLDLRKRFSCIYDWAAEIFGKL